MIVRWCQSMVLIMFVGSSYGCNFSLQSTQYAFVKNLFKAQSQVAEKNWQVSWDGRVYFVYAVNHDGHIYFANETGFLVIFDGFQVTSLSLPDYGGKKLVQIESKTLDDGSISVQFQNEGVRDAGSHLCSAWQSVAAKDGSNGWDQECVDGSTTYTNEIRTNEQSQVIALKQVVVPDVAPIFIAQRS